MAEGGGTENQTDSELQTAEFDHKDGGQQDSEAPEMAEGGGTENQIYREPQATPFYQRREEGRSKVTPVLEEEDLANQPLSVKHREKQFIPGSIVYGTEEAACQMTCDPLPKEPGTGVITIPDLRRDYRGGYIAGEHYKQERLGKGAGGETFSCKDRSSDKEFVEKRIEYTKMFNRNEVTIPLSVCQENMINYYGVIIDQKDNREIVVRILMEYGGTSLEKYVEEKTPSEIDKLNLLVQLSTVLAFLHDRGIIHNDVNPQNVVIRTDGDREHLKLIDFGAAMTSKESFNGRDGKVSHKIKEGVKKLLGRETVLLPAMMVDAEAFGKTVLFCYTGQFQVANPNSFIDNFYPKLPPDVVSLMKALTGKRMSVKDGKKILEKILEDRQQAAESPDEDLPVPANLVFITYEPRAMSSQQEKDGDSRL